MEVLIRSMGTTGSVEDLGVKTRYLVDALSGGLLYGL